MRRFFSEDISEAASAVYIRGEEFIHLKKVLRLTKGAGVAVFNGKGLEITGSIEEIERDFASVRVEGSSVRKRESGLPVTLIQGLVKGGKPELIIQKATELGVKEVSFYTTARTVPVISADKREDRIKRWRKVAIEAAKQCGRTVVPALSVAADLKSALAGRVGMLKLLLWEGEEVLGIKEAIKRETASAAVAGGVAIIIGPEGGLSEDDVASARDAGFIPAGLGPRILRSETAAIAALSIIQYEFGDMN